MPSNSSNDPAAASPETAEPARPLLLADDLSGALEAGVAFCDRGWRVVLPLEKAARAEESRADELHLVSTESRNVAPEVAAARVRSALTESGARQLVFKKIDSTLRGPVAAELRALLETKSPRLVVMSPANPVAGRTVVGGELRVNARPVATTEFARDPLWPVREGNVRTLLSAGGLAGVAHLDLRLIREGKAAIADALCASLRAGASVVVGDAEAPDDLMQLVLAAREVEPATVFVGSGALSHALAATWPARREKPAADAAEGEGRGLVFLCGSKHPQSRRQMTFLAREAGIALRVIVPGRTRPKKLADEVASDLERTGFAAMIFEPGNAAAAEVARMLGTSIGEIVAAIEPTRAPAGWFVTGGETAWSLCAGLGGRHLEVREELEPGTVAATLTGPGGTRWIVTKPGGFGAEGTMARVCSWWRQSAMK